MKRGAHLVKLFRRVQTPWLAAGIGVLCTLLAYRFTLVAEEMKVRAEFTHRSEVIANTIDQSLRAQEEILYGLRSLFHFSDRVGRTEFAEAAEELMRRHSGIQALEWIERVPAGRRAAFEAAVRQEGIPGFQFTERGPGTGLVRASDRPEHFPVTYVHPYLPNRAALGFDLASGQTWPDLQQATADNILMASGRLPLITDGEKTDWGYLFELPVYQVPVPADPAQRRDSLRGFLLGIFRLADVIDGSLREIKKQTEGLDLLVIDRRTTADRQFLYFRAGQPGVAADPPGMAEIQNSPVHRMILLAVPGRSWEVHFRATPAWVTQQHSQLSLLVLLAGLAGTGLMVSYLRATLRRTELVEREVSLRTAELRDAQKMLEEDIRQRITTEAELQENRRQLSTLISQLPGAAFRCLLDEQMTALFASEGMLALTGHTAEDFTSGRIHIASLTVPEDRAAVRAAVEGAIRERRPFEVEYRFQPREGPVKWVLVRGRPVYTDTNQLRFIEGLAIDVTAIKSAEQEKIALVHKHLAAQKLESLGVLAGGIAHDFNNILTVVLANASLARHEAGIGGSIERNLQQIEHAARRAADLCQQMLAYAGKGRIVSDRVDLNELVRGTITLLDVSINKNTRLALHLAESLPPVLADATQIRQIVMNLVINAADAIADQPGQITLSTFVREADATLLRGALGNPELPPGVYAGLEVSDNGAGMTPDIVARIFEPFFTTKFSGRGLGLSAVLGIVQSHHGALFVESTPGRGSLFRLLLPATADSAAALASPAPAPTDPVRLRGTILIVDDDDSVRKIAEAVLKINGARTLTAANGEAALELLEAQADKISGILLDMTMPGISGEETLRRMRSLHHQHPVILMSGYSPGEIMQHSAQLGVRGFLQKPFEIATLLAKVKPLLV